MQSGRTIEVLPVPARYFSSQKSEEEELFRHLKSFWAWPTKFGTSLVWIVRVPEKWLNLVTLNLLRFMEESLSNPPAIIGSAKPRYCSTAACHANRFLYDQLQITNLYTLRVSVQQPTLLPWASNPTIATVTPTKMDSASSL